MLCYNHHNMLILYQTESRNVTSHKKTPNNTTFTVKPDFDIETSEKIHHNADEEAGDRTPRANGMDMSG